jgi:hypothetical protein
LAPLRRKKTGVDGAIQVPIDASSSATIWRIQVKAGCTRARNWQDNTPNLNAGHRQALEMDGQVGYVAAPEWGSQIRKMAIRPKSNVNANMSLPEDEENSLGLVKLAMETTVADRRGEDQTKGQVRPCIPSQYGICLIDY